MSHAAFISSHRVTYAECTVGNHVYYARYLDILEKARGEFFRHLDHPLLVLQAQDLAFPVLESRLKYLSPARYDDLLQIRLWITLIKGVRLNFAYTILNPKGKPALEAETFHCCANLSEKPRRIPEDLHRQLAETLTGHH
jgi:acyl-CoA thioester hydrolase